MEHKKKYVCILGIILCFFNVGALNLAAPAALIPVARMAVSASYDVGGYTISNDSVASVMNRFQGNVTFAPLSFLNIGLSGGVSRMFVAGDTSHSDTIGSFKGDFGFSGGIHLTTGTRFFYNDLFRIIGVGKATFFSSSDKTGVSYGGSDGACAVGLQFHVPRFGYVTFGPEVYLISGKNKGYDGQEHRYSNINNVRGWLAIDFFPRDKSFSTNKYFLSLEVSLSPKADFNKEASLQEIRFSVGFGSITKRLYGEESDVEWAP
jgi:hypothetical protein